MSGEERLIVSLEARIRDFEKNFAKAAGTSNSNWNAIEQRAKRGAANLESSFAKATSGVNDKMLEVARGGAAALTAALGIEKLREMADEWTAFRGRIAASGVAVEDMNAKLKELSDIAIRSHATLEQVGTVYTALRRAAAELGASEAQTVRATETLEKALTLGGQGKSQTDAAILEISHALAGGRINGQELNKLLMEAPVLVKSIAKEFGVSTGQLRALKEEGQELGADKVFAGIIHGSQEIDAAFKKMTPTISQSMQMLETSMTRYVGETDQANGASKLLSAGIMALGDNINVTAPAAFTLSAALLGAFAGGPVLAGILGATTALVAFSGQIHPIQGELASLADYARVAWDAIKDKGGEAAHYLEERFAHVATSLSAALSGTGVGFAPLLDAVKTLGNAIIGSFVFTVEAIKVYWQGLGPALAETTITAVNGVIAAVEGMVNKVTSLINELIAGLNTISHANLSPIGQVDIGRVKNGFAGAGHDLGAAMGQAFHNSFQDYIGNTLDAAKSALGGFGTGLRNWDSAANREAKSNAPAATKPADEGSLDQPLKSSPDPKKVKAYNEIINKTKEFVQNQELERRELTESAEAASALRHEQELLNEASSKEIALTKEQKAQLKGLAEQMAHAEKTTQNLADMKSGIEQLGQSITENLTTAIEGLITRTRTWDQALRSLGEMLLKSALDAALWGKGPLAEITGQKDNGILSQAVRNMLPKSNAQPQQFLPTPAIPVGGNATVTAATVNVTAGTVNTTGATPSSWNPQASDLRTKATGGAADDFANDTIGTPDSSSGTTPAKWAPNLGSAANLAASAAPASAATAGAGARVMAGFLHNTTGDGYSQPHAASADMMGLKPGFRETMEQLQKDAAAQGIQTKAVSGYRDNDLQAKLYANYQARKSGQALPYPQVGQGGMAAAPGHSYHNYGEAADVIAVDPNKQAALTALARQPQRGIKVGADFGDYDHYEQGTYPEGQYPGSFGASAVAEAQKAAQEKAKLLADQMKATTTATTDLTSSLASTAPAAGTAATSIGGLISKLAGGLGGIFGASPAMAGGFASGGHVTGPGTSTSDSIPARLSHGEFVVNARATSKHRGLLEAVNSGRAPRFAMGGLVGGDNFASSSTFAPNTTINLSSSGNPRQDARLADQVGKAVSGAMAAHTRPDSFGYSQRQKLATANASLNRASTHNG